MAAKPTKPDWYLPHKGYESGDETEKWRGQLNKDTSWEAPARPLEVLLYYKVKVKDKDKDKDKNKNKNKNRYLAPSGEQTRNSAMPFRLVIKAGLPFTRFHVINFRSLAAVNANFPAHQLFFNGRDLA
jgi:hypothetical protein